MRVVVVVVVVEREEVSTVGSKGTSVMYTRGLLPFVLGRFCHVSIVVYRVETICPSSTC